jgi:DNA polymerase-3 subunit gamma/tau
MREILDNARYAPTVGRYKVYLIDEAHMLSKPAFNSMLKTLEEPPEHVKFVLATTDAPKIPVTVLSRCLQFNLKLLPPATIAARLSEILRAEGVAFDDSAVTLIARAARGSMRDALSVLDQALAYGAGEVRDGGVRSMLGTVDADYAYRIVDALIAHDGPALLEQARTLTERGVSLAGALEELALLLHRIALVQTVPDASDAVPDAERVKALAEAFAPDAVQLAYQICLQGRTDLSLAPDEQTGFSMTLLRLLAFDPATESPGAGPPRAAPRTEQTGDAAGELESTAAAPSASAAPVVTATDAALPATAPDPATWPTFVAAMKLSGMALQLAAQTELKAVSGSEFVLMVPEPARHLTDPPYADTLRHAIGQALGRRVRLRFEIGGVAGTSLAAKERREREAVQAKTGAAFRDDPFVQDLLSRFDARVKPNSIKPI